MNPAFVSDLRQSRRLEFVNGSQPYSAAGIDRTTRPGRPRLAGGGCFPLTPSLSLGERVSPSIRGGQSGPVGFPLRDARCSLSLRVRVRETARTTRAGVGPFLELSNWTSPPPKPEVSPNDNESSLL